MENSSSQGHPTAPLLQQIADEAQNNPRFWEMFVCFHPDRTYPAVGRWYPCSSMFALFHGLQHGKTIRYRPPEYKSVSGEIPQYVIDQARQRDDSVAQTLLSLVDSS